MTSKISFIIFAIFLFNHASASNPSSIPEEEAVVEQLAMGSFYGECIREPYPIAYAGEKIFAVFIAGALANNPDKGGTYFVIERLNAGKWVTVRTDEDQDTIIMWKRPYWIVEQRWVEISWNSPEDATPGTYRIRHFGYFLEGEGEITKPYIATSKNFEIRAPTL